MNNVNHGAMPPHSMEAEQAVLGSVLIDPSAYYEVSDVIEAKDFFVAYHGKVWESMVRLVGRRQPVDYVTLLDDLNARDIRHKTGNESYLIDLANVVPTSIMAESYARAVKAHSIRRQLILAGGQIATAAWDGEKDIDAVIGIAEAEMFSVTSHSTSQSVITVEAGLSSLYDIIQNRIENPSDVVGLPTGFKEFDHMKGGLKRAEMIVLAGRPGMGKSSLERQIAQNAARMGKNVLRFNLEMSVEQSMLRLISSEIGVDLQRVERGQMSEQEMARYYEAMGRLSQLPMWIDHTPALTIPQLRSRCRRLHAERGLDLITIDYLQLMEGSPSNSFNRVQAVSEISRAIKELALELNVPIIALAQLSRAVEQRADKRPLLSDLRESGQIENDADCVMFLYRDDYYNPDDSDRPNIAELNIAKHRNGPTGGYRPFLEWTFNQVRKLADT